MKSSRARFVLWSTALTLLSATLVLPATAAGAAKAGKAGKPAGKSAAKPAAAKPKDSGSSSTSSSSSSSKPATPYEVPAPASSDTATATATSTATSTSSSSSTDAAKVESSSKLAESPKPADPPAPEPPKESTPEVAPSSPSITLSQETTVPPVTDTTPPAEPAPVYVEHLGPDSYPGKLRGIYGGSLWLEPSFHGLQWPYMAKTGVGVSGVFWVDSGYEKIARDAKPTVADTSMTLQQGRGVLRLTPTYTNGTFFIQSQVELVGNLCQASGNTCLTNRTVDTDDLWIRFGQWNAWDVKVGRFEGWEVYHLGMGMDLHTQERLGAHNGGLSAPAGLNPPDFYGANWLQYRPSEGLGLGYLAFHAYPSQTVRFELLGELGASDVTSLGYTYFGGRPTLIFDYGWTKIKLAGEYEKRQGAQSFVDSNGNKSASKSWRTRKGGGLAVQFIIDPRAEFGGNIAYGQQESHGQEGSSGTFENDELQTTDSFTRISAGGFANLRVGSLWLLGGGLNFTWQNDKYYYQNAASPNYTAHLQVFGALQYLLARQLYIKAVIGYARADFVASDESIPVWSNTMISGRLRLMYVY